MEKKRELVDLLRKLIKSLKKIRREKLKIIENNMTQERKPIEKLLYFREYYQSDNTEETSRHCTSDTEIIDKINELVERVNSLTDNQK